MNLTLTHIKAQLYLFSYSFFKRRTASVFLLFIPLLFSFHLGYGQQVTKTNSLGGLVDGQVVTRDVSFTAADFAGGTSVADVNVNVKWTMVDVGCPSGVTGNNAESCFWLLSPSGTKVVLTFDAFNTHGRGSAIPPTYTGNASVPVDLDFDDGAAALVGGSNPVSGSFRPVEPLNILNGENPIGSWQLKIADGQTNFPMCFTEMSISVQAQPSQTRFYVDVSATGLNNGTSWGNAFNDLQDAFMAAGAGDSILVAQGTYYPDGASAGDRSLSFVLEDSLRLYGGFPAGGSGFGGRDPILNMTRLSGDIGAGGLDSYHVVQGTSLSGSCVLDGFIIEGGRAIGGLNNEGAGVYLPNNAHPEIKNCWITGNIASTMGGGMYIGGGSNPVLDSVIFSANNSVMGGGAVVDGGSPFFQNCRFNNNVLSSGPGGGLAAINGAFFFLWNCEFINNSAGSAGALRIGSNSSATIFQCDFSGNSSNLFGGAMVVRNGSTVSLDSCTFQGNSTNTANGGALVNTVHAWSILRNCQFENNFAGGEGGAIYSSDTSALSVINCEFRGNDAGSNGGAILQSDGPADITNSIFWRNTALFEGGAIFFTLRSDAVVSNCTFARDTVIGTGGGIRVETSSTVDVNNSIFWENANNQLTEDASSSLSVSYSTVMGGFIGMGNLTSNPLFENIAAYDLRLQAGSPAIDAGNAALVPPDSLDVDQDNDLTEPTPPIGGGDRALDNGPDQGGFESRPVSCMVVADCQNLSLNLDANGHAILSPTLVDDSSYSTCLLDSMWLSRDTLFCSDLPSTTVQLFVRDTSGAMDSCTATISLLDNSPPVAICQDITVYLDASGSAAIVPADIDGGTSDNCGVGPMVAFPDFFGCAQLGTLPVDLFVNDINGNFGNCTAQVTIEDTLPPTLSCPGDTILYLPNDTCVIPLPDFSQVGTLLLANSSGDFSGVQGQFNWYYGQYPAFTPASFTNLPTFSTSWQGVETGGTPSLDNNGGFPGTVSGNWSVRRWISTYSGVIEISGGYFDRDGTCGDGVDLRIFQNGNSIFSVSNITTSSTPYNFSVTVSAGDTLDFAIDPRLNSDCDNTHFTAIITADAPLQVIDNCGVDSLFSVPTPGIPLTVGTIPVTIVGLDNFGSVDSCGFNVMVVDTNSPLAVCIADSTPFYLSATGNLTISPTDIDGGSTDNCGIDSSWISVSSFGCTDGGAQAIQLTVLDENGLQSSCTSNILVLDTIPGTILGCPADIALDNTPGVCGRQVSWTPPTAADNCGVDSLVGSHSPGSLFPGGTTVVTYVAYFTSGSTDTCEFNVTINDVDPPVLSPCPTPFTVSNEVGACGATVSWSPPTVTDNCPGVTLLSNFNSPVFLPVGVRTIAYSASDQGGNIDSCTFTITVIDSELPQIACPADISIGTDAGVCGAQVTYTTPVGTDNCPSPTTLRTAGIGSGSTFPTGVTTETYRVTDGASLTATCSFTVTVTDDDPPTFSACPSNQVLGTDLGSCTALASWITPGTADNCGSVSLASSHTPGSSFGLGTTSVSYIATDGTGNVDSCVFTITVSDLENPQITCPASITVNNDNGICGATVSYTAPIGTDNCINPITQSTAGQGSGSVYPVGLTTETYVVTDGAGLQDSCSFTITVNDGEAPVFTSCPTPILMGNDLGTCGAVVNWTTPTYTDNCGPVTFVGSHASGDTFDVGVTTVTFTATDPVGLMDTCFFTVTITDDELPILTCPAAISVGNDAGQCAAVVSYAMPSATDNCPSVSVAQINGQGSGTSFAVGAHTETYLATDANGGMDSCSFNITVSDTELPTLTNCPADSTVPATTGQCAAAISWTSPLANDNCAVTQFTPSHAPGSSFVVGSTTVTYVAMDGSGNVDSCSFVLTVVDAEAPSITCPSAIAVNNDAGQCGATVTYTTPSATDNCTTVSVQSSGGLGSGSLFPVGITTEMFVATDLAGNTDSCSFTVTVTDTEAPVLAGCPTAITQGNDAGLCSAVVNWTAPSATDNCGVTLTASHTAGATFIVGQTSVSYVATDTSGNVDSCSFIVTISDTESPALTCPSNLSVSNDTGDCGAVVNWTAPTITDNCLLDSTFASHQPGDTFALGTFTISYFAQDDVGNNSACTFTVTVSDNESPTLVCPNDTTITSSAGFCAALVNYTSPVATDNCPGVNTFRTSGGSSGSLFFLGSSSVSFRSVDAVGNISNCAFTITVVDDQAPVMNCPGNRTVNSDSGVCGAIVNYAIPTFTDNCPGATLTLTNGLGPGALFPVGPTDEVYIVSDLAGNMDTCTIKITVIDIEDPFVDCPIDTVIANDAGICGGVFSYTPPVGFDNCIIDSLVQIGGLGSGALFPLGSTNEVWSVLDPASNFDTCSFTVTVIDAEAPVALCLNLSISLDSSGQYVVLPGDLNNNSTDNCGVDSLAVANGSFDCFDIGNNTATLLVFDDAGNSHTCTSTVVVSDTMAPVVLCQDTVLYLDVTGNASLVAADLSPGSFDNCSVVSQLINQSSFDCQDVGVQSVTLSATDPSFNTSQCTSQVTVLDTIPPNPLCQDTVLSVDTQGQLSVDVSAINAGSSDACGIDSTWLDLSQFSCLDVGQHSLVLTLVDVNGNTSFCTAQLTVVDQIAPTALCKDTILFLDSLGQAGVTVAQLDNGSFDNCDIDSLFASQTQFACSDLGGNAVTFSALDVNGNVSTCTSQVTIEDLIAPVITNCPRDTIIVVDSVNCFPSVGWTPPNFWDNCGLPLVSSNHVPFDNFSIGITRVLYTAVDSAGNDELCEFDVNVQPRQLRLTINGTQYACGYNITCNGANDGTASAYVSGGCYPYTYLWDNGDTTAAVTNLNAGWHMVTITDSGGTSLTDSLFITEPVPLSTQFSGNLDLCTTDTTGIIDLTVLGGSTCSSLGYQWSNGDTTQDLINVPAASYMVDIVDANGCTLTDTVTLNIFPPASVSLGPDTAICPKTGYQFTPASGFLYYYWSTGDTTQSITVDSAGEFSIRVVDSNGCEAVDTANVIQYVSPQVFLGNDTVLCNGDSILLDAGAGFLAYLWSVGGTTQTHTVGSGGLRWVEVTDTNSCTERDSISIGIHFVPDPNVRSVGPPVICLQDTLRLLSDTGFSSYSWSNGGTNFYTDVDSGGVYTLTVSDTSGCERTDSITTVFRAFADPDPQIQGGDTVFLCDGGSVNLDAGGGYTRYHWNTGDSTQFITVTQEGYYTVTVFNGFGCSEPSDSVFADSVGNPQPVIQRSGDTLICTPAGTSYQWYFNGVLLSGATDQTYYATQNGQYSVDMVDEYGCPGTATLEFLVGVEALSGFDGLELYPNPTGGMLNLRTYRPIMTEVEIAIVDMHGRPLKVYNPDRFEDVLTFNLQDLSAGIYVIQVKGTKGIWQRRFMIE